jgi:hypothetical protein
MWQLMYEAEAFFSDECWITIEEYEATMIR